MNKKVSRPTAAERRMALEERVKKPVLKDCRCGCEGRIVKGSAELGLPLWVPGVRRFKQLFLGHGPEGVLLGEFTSQKPFFVRVSKLLEDHRKETRRAEFQTRDRS